MSSPWDELKYGPWPEDAEVPHDRPDAGTRKRLGLPATLRPVPGAVQRAVFDPALKHHAKALRAGEPAFESAEISERWYAARRQAIDHVLAVIAGSEWVDNLVLRGSILLRAWYGEAAREPGDLDFVVVPRTWGIAERRTHAMLDGIARQAEATAPEGLRMDARDAVAEDIWTYDRVPGRRLVLTWQAGGLPHGSVQLDFVFNELLPADPEPTRVPRFDGGPAPLLMAATPELSLAWKVMWLLDDAYPQGKDLYDALLLAAHTSLSYRLLADAMVASDPHRARRLPTLDEVAALDVDWEEFRKEYPEFAPMPGTAEDTVQRLVVALRPTFTREHDLPEGEYARRAELLGPRIRRYAILKAEGGLDPVIAMMAKEDGIPVEEAVVIVNELLGRSANAVPHSLDLVMRGYELAGSSWIGYYRRNPEKREEILTALR
ncbi:nucleotidyl transferase AbiEii/AbiGii toxin family protein [Actinomadura barringtoniae]|uniref:Nucleotidyl transferase AbiEii/AbiGii toxin family protein n=1 Tax=Actinomadura barringtoniae TaxID=1427535 RepID=A0A939PQJ5_9ACTN|nr:nucleotidyl transferase AbiEii/AbiGii toxin family protein [Actinomadura barringtoniae]MBO2454398.1 nucleotidyl transferase AbiEii/AbiGii toxin family protein [Actinomadura barringtoniae]